MADEWSPWIEHDGGVPLLPTYGPVHMRWVSIGRGRTAPSSIPMSDTWPGFYWSWQEAPDGCHRRVCCDPAYAPIVRYRFRRPQALRAMIDMIETYPYSSGASK